MPLLPPQIEETISAFARLPGIGPKSAERLTFHLLQSSSASPEELGNALLELKKQTCYCSVCQMVCIQEQCSVCSNPSRDQGTILVVESPLDVVAFEKTSYDGVYHILHGVLSPIDGMGPEQLKLKELMDRCEGGSVNEVIVATNPDVEGEATATYIQRKLEGKVARVTRLAHGLPMGADIEFADQVTLREALAGRREL